MIKYHLNMQTGKLSLNQEASPLETSDISEVWLLRTQEFKSLEGPYPYKKNLIRSLEPIQYCKIDMYSECIQGTMKVPKGKGKSISYSDFAFYVKENHLIFIDDESIVKTLLEKIMSHNYGKCSIHQLLLILIDMLTEDDVLYLQRLETNLEEIEEGLLNKNYPNFNETLIAYRKKLSVLHSYYEQLVNMGDQMQMNMLKELTPEECTAWMQFTHRVERLHNQVEMLREHLVQLRELHQSQTADRQNAVMSFLTVVTTIFLPLTLIAGWYGMNFTNMPELHWKYGYPCIILVSVLVIIIEILYFKKKKLL